MELQYIVLTIIKILISVPAIVVLINREVDAAALIGGHVKNDVSKINTTDSYDFKIDLTDENSQEYSDNTTESGNSEEVPDPSPLIVPGYNLPENIFNRGKPFYLEKDPLTGSIDFDSKASSLKVYDDYEYEDELPYDKSQIDRKDGPISGVHKPSDINQLTPNFHDFLNLPVKYNPDKYVYPLISSSYANTKVQGNVNKQHNHKNYEITTYKPTLSPTYFTTKKVYSQNTVIEYGVKDKEKYGFEATGSRNDSKNPSGNLMQSFQEEYPTTKKPPSSTTNPIPQSSSSWLENRGPNLMHSPMNHPSFSDEYETTVKTTTKRVMSLFEQLFGSDYEDSTTEIADVSTKPTPPKLFDNLPSNKKSTTTQNILAGNMGYTDGDDYKERPTTQKEIDDYEYYDYYTTASPKEKEKHQKLSNEKPIENNEKPTETNEKQTKPTGINEKYPDSGSSSKETDQYSSVMFNQGEHPGEFGMKETYQSGVVNTVKYPMEMSDSQKYPSGSATGGFYPTTGVTNYEKYPTGISNNEKYSNGMLSNDKYHIGVSNNEKYPNGMLVNEKYPNGMLNNEKYPNGMSINEKYPNGMLNNEKFPDVTANKEKYQSSSLQNEKYPSDLLKKEKYPLVSANNPSGLTNNEKYPSSDNGFYPNNEESQPGGITNDKHNERYQSGSSNNPKDENYPPSGLDVKYPTGYGKYPMSPSGEDYATGSNEDPPEFGKEKYGTTSSGNKYEISSVIPTTTTERISSGKVAENKKVTSLPLGENHVTHFHSMIASNNLREKLNAEKVVEQKYNSVVHPQAPSASNIHIAPDQDIVSFVVGNHQNVDGNEGNGAYVGSSLKESPYDNNPFRPVYNLPPVNKDGFRWNEQQQKTSVSPVRTTEPVLVVKNEDKHGNLEQVIVVENDYAGGNKIVFPTERPTTYTPDLSPPPPPKQALNILNREVLKLSSKPMFHQLPSDLTPPGEKEGLIPPRLDRERVRPPWDPRPGHFHAGRPEYARPPRPVPELYKRIDNLPNILPQFRPNMKLHHGHPHPHHHHHHHHYQSKNYARQPLLDRPSNRPIGFFEKLHPPPLSKNDQKVIEDRIGLGSNKNHLQEPFAFLQAPPKVVVSNRRNGDDIETLQMIQAKKDKVEPVKSSLTTSLNGKDTLEKPLYVVYPVNTPPLKLDVLDTNKKESVVIGTRAELPLPPSKISQDENNADYKKILPNEFKSPISSPDFNYELSERHDAPILKPRPGPFPVKTDFPYPLERPDPSILNPETVEDIGNNIPDEPVLLSSNQWNTIDDAQARIVNHNQNPAAQNQISVTLKTHTEKPIAVAYTPTESPLSKHTKNYIEAITSKYAKDHIEAITSKNKHQDYHDRFSMPNYGGVVIPEIRPNSEITVSAVMHARPQPQKVDRVDEDTTIPAQDFQAPFQASAHVDHSISQGWSVVKNKDERKDEATTVAVATTSEFDIENFKPQLEGGFKPIYSFPEEQKDSLINERQE